ncbi:MAG: formyltetrahydrofolate deformylase [Pseudonocardiaceae bacterium]|nr:formyltetrahydrofolate deformylase [Pseudonocardiaceae bacterium]
MRDLGRLLISCPDRPGIVATVTGYLFRSGATITESQQYTTDPNAGRFFLRLEFVLPELERKLADLEHGFTDMAEAFGMEWRFTRAARIKRLAIMVSKADHALQELLWRRKTGDLRAEISMVISNHPDLAETVHGWGLPFHHIPVSAETKAEAEEKQLNLLADDVDTVVLARYMQVLSPDFLSRFPNQAINIHHSFLPAFVGANPYAAAEQRGVKLIGATAHYVTADLDAGPIIEQDVCRVDHRHSVADLRRSGRYVERAVLARAVSWHVEDRVIVHDNKTIVFA